MGEEVAALKADKEELQYILAAHRNTCSLQVKAEPVTEEESPVYVEVQPKEETVKLQRHALQRHPQLQHPAGGEDRPDPDQHPEPHQSVGWSEGQLQPQHSNLWQPGEKTDSDGPSQSQHSGSPYFPVPSPPHLSCQYLSRF